MARKVEEKNEIVDLVKIKEELTDYIDLQIRKEFADEIDRVNKRVIREKNKKILFRNIVIILLLGITAFEFYLLYKSNYFNKFFTNNNQQNTSTVVEEKKEEEKEKAPTLDDLKKEYGYLLDSIKISEESEYTNEYYEGNLTKELKKYIVLNNMNFSEIALEDDYNVIDEELFKNKYEQLFNEYSNGSFDYNGNKIRYISKLGSYITDKVLTKPKTNIKREIIDIKVNDDKVKITTIEGLLQNDKIYNIVSKEEIGDSLLENKDKLNKVVYTFENKKLVSLK